MAGPGDGAAGVAAAGPGAGAIGVAAAVPGKRAAGVAAAAVDEDRVGAASDFPGEEPREGAVGAVAAGPREEAARVAAAAGRGEDAIGVAAGIRVIRPGEEAADLAGRVPADGLCNADVPVAALADGLGDAADICVPAIARAAATVSQTGLRMRVSREEIGRAGAVSRLGHFGWKRPLRGLR